MARGDARARDPALLTLGRHVTATASDTRHRAGKPPRRVQLENRVAVTVDPCIDEVWAIVRDVTRVGEWSHECAARRGWRRPTHRDRTAGLVEDLQRLGTVARSFADESA